jgi:hypothetical protein
MAELIKNKKDLAHAIATTKKAQSQLAAKIKDLVAQQFKLGNIPSRYNGTLSWPMPGVVSNEFGCSSYPGYGPGNGCEHFHNGSTSSRPRAAARRSGPRAPDGSAMSAGTTPTARTRPGS